MSHIHEFKLAKIEATAKITCAIIGNLDKNRAITLCNNKGTNTIESLIERIGSAIDKIGDEKTEENY